MQARNFIGLVALASSGCLMSHDLPCEGGGVRGGPDNVCMCPEGTVQIGRKCVEDEDAAVVDGDVPPGDGSSCEDDCEPPDEDAGEDAGTAVDAAMGTDAAIEVDAADSAAADGGASAFWYRDCDGDGFAATRSGRLSGEQKPAATAECFDWTHLEPDVEHTDCDDANEHRHPGAGPGLPLIGGKLPEQGSLAYDLDCDGTATPQVDFVSTGVIRAGQLEVFGFCEADPVCPEASKCMVSFIFPETPLCGAQYPADVALDDVRCTQSIPIYFLCQ